MHIDPKIRSILTGKLHFSVAHIKKLENNAGLLARTMNLLSMVQKSPHQPAVRQFVQVQLKKIRQSLDEVPSARTQLLMKAREEFYSFQRSSR